MSFVSDPQGYGFADDFSEIYSDTLFGGLERNEPEPGSLLCFRPNETQEPFTRAVAFIVDNNHDGALAVQLDLRSQTAIHEVFPEWDQAMAKPKAFYIGGPVENQRPICIGVLNAAGRSLEAGTTDSQGEPLFEPIAHNFAWVNLGANPEEVQPYLKGARIFVGYLGWSPGQLDDEIQRGDWYVAPALASDVLSGPGDDVWSDVMRRQPWPLPLYATFPRDLQEN